MDKQFYNILNPIFQEVMKTDIDQATYNQLVKCVRLDRSPASIARIKASLIMKRDNITQTLQTPSNRQITILKDDSLKLQKELNVEDFLKDKKILVISYISNFSLNASYVQNFLDGLKTVFHTVCFHFITSNNTDDTIETLQSWCENNPESYAGIFERHVFNIKEADVNKYKASQKNYCYEEALKRFNNHEFDYLIYIDSNITSDINLKDFMTCFYLDEPWDIICGNRVFNRSMYHSDLFDLRLPDQNDDITTIYPYIKQIDYNSLYWIDKLYIFHSWYKVSSAFGGIMLINKKVFKLQSLYDKNLGKYDSENISLCNKFLNIYVNPNLIINNRTTIESTLYQNPYLFVPTDHDFFYVLNNYVHALSYGFRIYPYYNYEKLSEALDIKHFKYIDTTRENCWFEFFDPIEFYRNDKTHVSQDILLYNNYYTNETIDQNLYKDDEWRKKMNLLFNKFITLNPKIQIKVDTLACEVLIGIYYTHPGSQFNDSPFFKKYFSEIDRILEEEQNESAKLFLLTDTDFGLLAFKNKYERILTDESYYRTDIDCIIEWGKSRKYVGSFDTNNKLKNGFDILSNVLALAKCKYVILPECAVCLALSYINPNIIIRTV